MSEIKTIENRVVMNEYLEVSVKPDLVQLCSDCYHALGWTIINSCSGIDTVKLKLQRDRKIRNRVALCDLQRKCEDAFINIEKLERSKNTRAMALALGVGIVGTVFLAGATFAYLAAMIPLSIVLAIPGFIGWGLPYFLYKKNVKKSTDRVNPMIESNYDAIYEACEKASQLLV
ncbi:hypothetical protein GH808_07680 [Acetobacterium fimetarium]|uniref:Positive regulator of sigma(E), RseC/MucC n=1 Tax=Acetobacterium fimetarium TaxID=52691 RepID=A0ABR6WUU0_9FIRM|nr:hypothetical protein [Acetobacterium fimetarium]MBC3804311.1 hypothetical protein [Acetobacterium fimetarium]